MNLPFKDDTFIDFSKRVLSKTELEILFSSLPCEICGELNTDANHIINRSQGGRSTFENLNTLCRQHHEEWTRLGKDKMFRKYPSIRRSYLKELIQNVDKKAVLSEKHWQPFQRNFNDY